jgi:glycosyltransferase involved in cell wall biosynthesis
VHFTGRLPDVKGAIGGSTISVVPLLTGGGTRLKVLEALALGTPVVSTSKGIEGLDVTDGVHVLVADTAETFAGAILRLLAQGDLAARLSDAGRMLVARSYTWDAIGRRLLEVVDGAIEGTRP